LGNARMNLATPNDPPLASAPYPLGDAGNAEAFVQLFGESARYDHARNRWLVWLVERALADRLTST